MSFPGKIGITAAESTPWWSPACASGERPNLITIILDDMGWADLGCFGSSIDTSNLDHLASEGTRFTNFHVTPLCSPTRAAMLTGCDPHRVGMRFLADADTGFPNARGSLNSQFPVLPELLRESGYATYLIGKWHLCPLHEITPAGPTHNWPLAKGFERFYGFLDGCTDQYTPELFDGNQQVEPPDRDDYILTEDLIDRAVSYIRDHVSFRSSDPFYLNVALPATHAPFQAPSEYVDKYRECFTHGWDEERRRRLERQKELGVVPVDAVLTDPSAGSHQPRRWDDLSPAQQRVDATLQATFAAFLDHTDKQLGRLFDELDALGLTDNTIIAVFSDNGASREGGTGDLDCNVPYSQVSRSAEEQLQYLDRAGSRFGPAHYAQEWAMAGNTPFRFYKQWVDCGGVRSPLIVRWAKMDRRPGQAPSNAGGDESASQINRSFLHVMDLFPTLLRAAKVQPPAGIDGIDFTEAVTRGEHLDRPITAFEMLGHRALRDGRWMAVIDHQIGSDYSQEKWRLYDCDADFSQAHDLASKYPDVVDRMHEMWWEKAEELDFFPLDDRPLVQLLTARNPRGLLSQSVITMRPRQGHIPFPAGVGGTDRPLQVCCFLKDFAAQYEGALIASGNATSGYALSIQGGYLVFDYHFAAQRLQLRSQEPVPQGDTVLGMSLEPTRQRTGNVSLWFALQEEGGLDPDSRRIQGTLVLPLTTAHLSFWGVDIGRDPVSAVGSYAPPFAFPEAHLDRVEMHFDVDCEISGYVLAMEARQ